VCEKGYSPPAIERLILTNWVRTVAWTVRSGIVLALLLELLPR
jgi:hypothetical protein